MHVTEPTLLDSVEALFHTTLVGVVYQKATGEIERAGLALLAAAIRRRQLTAPRRQMTQTKAAGDQLLLQGRGVNGHVGTRQLDGNSEWPVSAGILDRVEL